jgi:hypothetical protein
MRLQGYFSDTGYEKSSMCFDPERKGRQGYARNFSREVIRPDLTLIYVSEMGATVARMACSEVQRRLFLCCNRFREANGNSF